MKKEIYLIVVGLLWLYYTRSKYRWENSPGDSYHGNPETQSRLRMITFEKSPDPYRV